jgi:hypothetical protein
LRGDDRITEDYTRRAAEYDPTAVHAVGGPSPVAAPTPRECPSGFPSPCVPPPRKLPPAKGSLSPNSPVKPSSSTSPPDLERPQLPPSASCQGRRFGRGQPRYS